MKNLCIDFDGVIHSYTSPWTNAETISDPPVPGAIEWLTNLVMDGRFNVNIYSSRSKSNEAIMAMRMYLVNNGMRLDVINQILFPTQKPAAHMTIDDRAFCFKGEFPTIDWLVEFKPWNR